MIPTLRGGEVPKKTNRLESKSRTKGDDTIRVPIPELRKPKKISDFRLRTFHRFH